MNGNDYRLAANALDHAEKSGSQIGCISQDFPAMTMADAYGVQAEWVALKLAAGRRILGRKIGLTSRAMQQQLGIDIPDSGILFDDMFFENGAVIPKGRFIEPRVEAEIAFIMGQDLQGSNITATDVLNATKAVAPALEILDTRNFRVDPNTGQSRSVFDTISDNAANAGIVLGDARHAPSDVDLPW
ncbi:MAG: 2-oxo-hept-3-ene-1,7-dioate hydratase, partial [Paracoccaceae bacterium]